MPVTPIRKIFKLGLGTKWNPVVESTTQADSIEEALKYAPVAVGSESERLALFSSSPYQGASVYRLDTGDTERYFDTYNASSNPGGRTPAGWYSENQKIRTASFTATGLGANNNTLYKITNIIPVASKTVNNDFATIPSNNGMIRLRAGLYSVSVSMRMRTSATGRTLLEIVDGDNPVQGVITRVSIGIGEDMTTMVNGNLYVIGLLNLQIDYLKNADASVGAPTFNFDITKIG